MTDLLKLLDNRYVFFYVLLVIVCQFCYVLYIKKKKQQTADKRKAQGLPPEVLVNQSITPKELKWDAIKQALVLIVPVVFLPFILGGVEVFFADPVSIATLPGDKTGGQGLLFTFLIFLIWLLFTGTDLAKAAIGGIAFRTVMALSNTVRVGDRITINGQSGKLVEIGIFYLILVTLDDDKVCLPTNSLWGADLSNANDGHRCSLVVTKLYLSPVASKAQLQAAEDAIWEAIQASSYFEPSKPKQIFYQQQPTYIEFVAKAYVASTYNELLFRSDITKRFLMFAKEENILLANQQHDINLHQAP
ncbi:MAG: small-conductance mechanosensitive channel, partial [Phenylobacterium sp.]